jgi:hypothetical protein
MIPIVSGGTIRVELREPRCVDDPVDDLAAVHVGRCQLAGLHAAGHAYAARVAQVRQNAQADTTAGDRRQTVRHRLGDAVDEVRPHRVFAIDDQMHDEHVVGEHAGLDAARAAAAHDHPLDGVVGELEDLVSVGADSELQPPRLTSRSCLRDHQRQVRFATSPLPRAQFPVHSTPLRRRSSPRRPSAQRDRDR